MPLDISAMKPIVLYAAIWEYVILDFTISKCIFFESTCEISLLVSLLLQFLWLSFVLVLVFLNLFLIFIVHLAMAQITEFYL